MLVIQNRGRGTQHRQVFLKSDSRPFESEIERNSALSLLVGEFEDVTVIVAEFRFPAVCGRANSWCSLRFDVY